MAVRQQTPLPLPQILVGNLTPVEAAEQSLFA
jgi:hypothetical protein